jgi:hypothetical protein
MVNPPVRALEDALHEAHVIVHKRERAYLTCHRVGSRHRTADERQADEAVEIGDGRWLSIWRIENPGPEHVEGAPQCRRTSRNGFGLS